MFTVGLYLFAVLGFVLAEDLPEKCLTLIQPDTFKCCSIQIPLSKMAREKMDACNDTPINPNNCDHEKCVAAKFDLVSSDGNLDKSVLADLVLNDAEISMDFKATLKKYCVESDLAVYGPPGTCDFKNLQTCMMLHGLNQCPEWNGEGACKDVKELIGECKSPLTK